jgi:hypothetical protein
MANEKISALNGGVKLTNPASGDLLAVTDISDTTEAVSGTTKPMEMSEVIAEKVRTTTGPTVLTVGAVADNQFLKRSGTTVIGATPGGGGLGDVVGPASATDNALARYDTTTGKLIQDSPIMVDDNGAITLPEIAAPATPAAGKVVIYVKSDGLPYSKDDAGVESGLAGGGGTTNPTDTLMPYNNAGTFADSPLARTDANTIEHSNGTSATSVRYNLYGLKNGANFERFSWYYDSVNSKYVWSVNKGGTGTLRSIELEMDGTAFWRFRTDGKIYGLSNSASIISVGEGTASVPGLQFGSAGSSTGIFGESGPYLSLTTNAGARLSVHDFGALLGSSGRFGWATTALGSGKTEDTSLSRETAGRVLVNDGSGNPRDLKVRQPYVDQAITPGGTTGNQTIDKAAGTVNIAAGNSSVVVTNNLVSTSSLVFAVIRTNDATATIKNVVPASGSFTINLTAAATAEISIGFLVVNK